MNGFYVLSWLHFDIYIIYPRTLYEWWQDTRTNLYKSSNVELQEFNLFESDIL